MDPYNPEFDTCNDANDIEIITNKQNLKYGANEWYPYIKDYTAESVLLELTNEQIEIFSAGEVPLDLDFKNTVEKLISDGYTFVKSTHKSSYAKKPMTCYEDFTNEITEANVIMSFRRYKCKFLFFRKWEKIDFECRVYVHDNRIKYMEQGIDNNNIWTPNLFPHARIFVEEKIIPILKNKYTAFTSDLYLDKNGNWKIVEINSPLWLKAGTYRIDYSREKDRIHNTRDIICRYKDIKEGCVMEITM